MIASGRSVNRPPHILLLMTLYSYSPLIFVAAPSWRNEASK
jgi:hypothetical protein